MTKFSKNNNNNNIQNNTLKRLKIPNKCIWLSFCYLVLYMYKTKRGHVYLVTQFVTGGALMGCMLTIRLHMIS